MSRLITLAIHTYERALLVRTLLENEGIRVELNNVNLEVPGFSSGVRVRIRETDLPLALRIVENQELFSDNISPAKFVPHFSGAGRLQRTLFQGRYRRLHNRVAAQRCS